MRSKHIWAVVFGAILIPCLIFSQTLEDKVKEFTLDNGMRFIVVERPVAPVFFAAVAFKVGSIDEWDGVTGISHLLEHMMFKGTKTVGTANYAKEKKYLEKEDQIAAQMRKLKREIGNWRLEIFEDYSRKLMASLDEEQKQEIGNDKAKELSVLVSLLETRQLFPTQAAVYPTLMEDRGTDYFAKYIDLKRHEIRLREVAAEHRHLIIQDELWDAYVENGGRMLNAFTANDMTGYIVYLPSNRLELWMMLESDRMKEPVFREFYSERDVVAEERRLHENDPEGALEEALLSTAFQASAYGRPVVGWMSDIQAITREDLTAYHERFYAPNNATAVLVGDVDVEEVRKLARRYFGRIRPQELPGPIETVEPEQKGERRVSVEFPANPQVMIAYHVPVAPHPDSYPISMLVSLLGRGRTSRLYKKIYEDLELTSRAPFVTTEPGERADNLLIIQAVPRHPHTTEEVEQAIYELIETLKAKPPTEREIQRLRNRIDASMVRVLGSNLGIAFNLGLNAVTRGSWRAYLEDNERAKQVRPEQISQVAMRYLTPHNRTVATLIKSEEEVGSEEVDFRALMEWIRTLPRDEQKAILERVQMMTEEEKEQYAKGLMKRMKSEAE